MAVGAGQPASPTVYTMVAPACAEGSCPDFDQKVHAIPVGARAFPVKYISVNQQLNQLKSVLVVPVLFSRGAMAIALHNKS